MNTHPISESLETNLFIKILNFFHADPGSGMEKIRTRDKHPGSATLRLAYLRALRKLAGWQGRPWPVSSMWKRKESSQAKQDSREQKWFRIIIRSFSAIQRDSVKSIFNL